MRLKYYRLQAVLSTGKFIYPILASRGTQYEHSVCYTTLPLCQNWPEQFISNFTNETEYYRLQAVLRTGKSIHPIPSSRGTQYNHSVCYTTVPPSPNWPEAFISNFTNEILEAARCFEHRKVYSPYPLIPRDTV